MSKKKDVKKVVVAMSGGVDSSVSAALLKKAGFEVIGVFMKFWLAPRSLGEGGAGYNRCCSQESEIRARKVAKILKIPFYVFNFEKEFKKRIVDYFLREYKGGQTPNPCVVCNKEIKFGLLLEKALKLNADYIATGHYARLRQETLNHKTKTSNIKLLKGKDEEKDQSYFLWQLSQKQLKHILFPVGGYTKTEVRKLAKKFKLPFAKVPESMEICFIQTTINEFLKKYLKEKPGKIICSSPGDEQKVVGEHKGLWFYTIGQRRGLGLGGGPSFAKASAGKPYFVLNKDEKKNILIVTKNEKDLFRKELVVKNVNWISGKKPELPMEVQAKIRYRSALAKATIVSRLRPNVYNLRFKISQRAITPGQSVVFYKGKELLGGGIIC